MKQGKAGLTAPVFLMRLLRGKTGCVSRRALGVVEPPAEPIFRFQGQRRKGIWRNAVNVVRWVLLGFIIAGPNPTGVACQHLHSQDPRLSRAAGKKQPITSLKQNQLEPSSPAPKISEPARASAPSREEIVLPDIYITLPADTIAALKKQLEQAERDLRQLERERSRILKTLDQFQKRSFNGASPHGPRTTELLGRPSV